MRWTFAHASGLLPLRRVAESPLVLAFHHPRPHWPIHLLLVPKRALPGLLAAGPRDLDVLAEVFRLAEQAAAGLHPPRGCTLLVNGGAYQDVGQLHFHLVGGAEEGGAPPPPDPGPPPGAGAVDVAPHPFPRRATHLLLRVGSSPSTLAAIAATPALLASLLAAVQSLVRGHDLEAAGFTLLVTLPPAGQPRPLVFQLVSGASLPASG